MKVPRKKRTPKAFPEGFRGVEKKILDDPLIQQVAELARQEKVPLYLVGGAIRDILLGRKIRDYDFSVKEVEMPFLDQLGGLLAASVFPMGKGKEAQIYRLATGEQVIDFALMEGDDIEQDLMRRDFTINALAYSFDEGRFFTAPQSIEDLKAGRIDLVSSQALKADPLRMLRAVRYCCTLPGFVLTDRLKEEIKRHKALLTEVAPERIRAELDEIILSPFPAEGLGLMHEIGLLTCVFPELAPLEDLPQGRYHVTDALSHTIEVVREVDQLMKREHPFPFQPSRDDQLIVGYAALFHDLGKPATKSIDAGGEIHFYGHPARSSLLAQGIMKRLRFPSTVRDGVIPLVENHMRILTLAIGEPLDKALRRLIHAMGEGIRLLVVLGLAETGSKQGGNTEEGKRFMDLCGRIWDLYDKEDLITPEPLLMGRDLLGLGHTPGPRLGEILAEVRRRQIAGELKDREEALQFVQEAYPPDVPLRSGHLTPEEHIFYNASSILSCRRMSMEEKIAVYPGSFDPITYGHVDIIKRSLMIFDKVIVAVAHNFDKASHFTPEERVVMIKEALKAYPNVSVASFEGLLMDYMKGTKANVVLRGLRATSDFEYEYHMAVMNRSLNDEIDTLFMMTGKDYFFVSSRTIKEVASLGGSVAGLVPENVALKLKEKFAQQKKG